MEMADQLHASGAQLPGWKKKKLQAADLQPAAKALYRKGSPPLKSRGGSFLKQDILYLNSYKNPQYVLYFN